MHLPSTCAIFNCSVDCVSTESFSRKVVLEKRYLESHKTLCRPSLPEIFWELDLREPFSLLSVENRSNATCRLHSRDHRKFPNTTGTGTRASARCQSFVIADQTILVWAKFSDKSTWIASLVVARVSNQTWSAQTFIGKIQPT